MGETTGISWCDATFNPWIGCTKISPGCKHCYAETLVTGRMGRQGTWGPKGTRERTTPANWRKPIAWARSMPEQLGRRPRVFCASLADVFEPRPELAPWREELLALVQATPELDWLLLTKRPDVALERFRSGGWELTANLWIGTSIESSEYTWRADALREIPAAIRFISAEPLLGSLFKDRVQLATPGMVTGSTAAQGGEDPGLLDLQTGARQSSPLDLWGIDWVIVGGESGGPKSRPMHPDWAREIRDAILWGDLIPCGDGCCEPQWPRPAFHFKQWGSWSAGYPNDDDGRAKRVKFRDTRDAYMRYTGAAPTSGGRLLDGQEWLEFPTSRMEMIAR